MRAWAGAGGSAVVFVLIGAHLGAWGAMLGVNVERSFMHPPIGFTLFYFAIILRSVGHVRSVAPEGGL